MRPSGTQRWLLQCSRLRPLREPIDTRQYEVAAIAGDTIPKAFIRTHHYAPSYPNARFRFGLYRTGGELVGIAVFAHPMNDRLLTNIFPGRAKDSVELARFVLLDEVPSNGETWFLGQCFRSLRKNADLPGGVVSCADPTPRRTADGRLVMPGHVGTIYQAFNGAYVGRTKARVLNMFGDGTVFSERAKEKIRGWERGAAYAIDQLVMAGATLPPTFRDKRGRERWLKVALGQTTRPLRHAGNHRYAWPLRKDSVSIALPRLTYPKKVDVTR